VGAADRLTFVVFVSKDTRDAAVGQTILLTMQEVLAVEVKAEVIKANMQLFS
jgi:hypothetical protein